MDWLIAHDVHATIFMTGAMADNVNTAAGRDVLARIDAHPGLFTLGNHSYTHADFRDLSAAQMASELRRTEDAIEPWCSQDPRPFFRPPFGGYDAEVLAAVGAAGYRRTVLWEIDTIDWRPIDNDPPGPTATEIVAKVLTNAQGGSIVLMHLGGYETFEALPSIVEGLGAAGYDLVNLDELLERLTPRFRSAILRYNPAAPLASGQAVRRLTLDQEIEGSNPSSPATIRARMGPRDRSPGPLFGLYHPSYHSQAPAARFRRVRTPSILAAVRSSMAGVSCA